MSTKKEPIRRGTLVCVVLKAKNLPNKRSIGKQDPYCVLQLGTEQQKTKPDKRGGQHPQWDEQLHFEIFDDMEDQLRKTTAESNSSSVNKQKEKAKKTMRVTCYADDSKEPEFIGDGIVDLTDTLKTGEFDEWVTIKAKDRYAGEVYLELTFYSSAAPPKPKKTIRHNIPAGTTYGGAGTFSEDFEEADFAPRLPTKQPAHASIPSSFMSSNNIASAGQGGLTPNHPRRTQNMTASKSHSQFGSISGATDGVPSSLRPSASMAHIDTYTPPYAPPHIQRERTPGIPASVSEYGGARRDSFPPAGQSASSHFYGHRLQDAAPQHVAAPHIQEDARRHSQHMSNSSTFQYLPHQHESSSVSTIRPAYSNGGNVDDLVGSMSTMSMQASQHPAETQHGSYQHQQQYGTPSYGAPQGSMPPSMTVDQFGRPMPIVISPASEPANAHTYTHISPAPTAQHSTSPAPPNAHYQPTLSQYSQHYPPSQPAQPPPVQHPQPYTHLSTSPAPPPRPASPAASSYVGGAKQSWQEPAPPIRTHTPSGYHALPLPPHGASESQAGSNQPGRSPSPLPFPPSGHDQPPRHSGLSSSASSHVGLNSAASPQKPAASRPLPSTGAPPPLQTNIPAPAASPAHYAQQSLSQVHPSSNGSSYYAPSQGYPGAWQPGYSAAQAPQPPHSPAPPSHYAPPPPQYAQPSYPGYPPPPPSEGAYQNSAMPPPHGGNTPSPAPGSHVVHYPPPPPGPLSMEYGQNSAYAPPPPHLYQHHTPPPPHLAQQIAPPPPPPGPHPPATYYQPAHSNQQLQYPY